MMESLFNLQDCPFIVRLYSPSTFDIKTYSNEIMAKYLKVVPGAVAAFLTMSLVGGVKIYPLNCLVLGCLGDSVS